MRERSATVKRVRGALCLAAAVLAVAWSPAADAGDRPPRAGVELRVDGGHLSFERLAPGIGSAREVLLVTGSDRPLDVRLGVDRLASQENGCVRPELLAGDPTCATTGELLPWLRVRLERVGTDSTDDDTDAGTDAVPLFVGTMVELADRERGVLVDVPVTSRQPVRLRMTVVPAEAMGNDTMTDTVGFSLWWSSGGAASSIDARPVELAERSGVPADREVSFRPEILLIGALLVVASGHLVRRVLPAPYGRRRRSGTHRADLPQD
ncbi:hypothetical protein [Nocardioides halotolerans]|uniref:hypothetical protein n=1 Tax=Nocardioides halotolerans TaxID=433660 RepID=UPI0004293A07|nr:hypothetical protein [Nocardioides halotolerans]